MADWCVGVGDSDPVVAVLKRRLGFVDCSVVVTDALVQRVRGIQLIHGLEPDGVLDDAVLGVVGVGRDV